MALYILNEAAIGLTLFEVAEYEEIQSNVMNNSNSIEQRVPSFCSRFQKH